MNVFINYSTLTALCAISNRGEQICKYQKAMQVNLYKLYTTYLVSIFAMLNNLNLKMQEYNHNIIVFYSSSNVLKLN